MNVYLYSALSSVSALTGSETTGCVSETGVSKLADTGKEARHLLPFSFIFLELSLFCSVKCFCFFFFPAITLPPSGLFD